MKIEEFLNKSVEEIIYFDFTDEVLKNKHFEEEFEFLKQEYLNSNIELLKKYILYKTKLKIDPDNNDGLLKKIYKTLWDDDILSFCESNDKSIYYSDTMTSAQNLIKGYYRCLYDKDWKNYEENKEIKELFNRTEIHDFIKCYHTLGNYIPVAKGFNSARSGLFASHDMWDITLEKIKEYYDKKENNLVGTDTILELLHMKDTINSTINWLNSFATWENFVDKNYLKDVDNFENYVDENYEIKKIANHNFSDPKLKSMDEYKNYIEKITQIIKNRTLIMYRVLLKKRTTK